MKQADKDKLYNELKCEFSFNGQRLEYMNRASFHLAIKQALAEAEQMHWPKGQDLIKFAQQYVNEECKELGTDALGLTYQHLEQQQFLRIVNWIRRELPKWKGKNDD